LVHFAELNPTDSEVLGSVGEDPRDQFDALSELASLHAVFSRLKGEARPGQRFCEGQTQHYVFQCPTLLCGCRSVVAVPLQKPRRHEIFLDVTDSGLTEHIVAPLHASAMQLCLTFNTLVLTPPIKTADLGKASFQRPGYHRCHHAGRSDIGCELSVHTSRNEYCPSRRRACPGAGDALSSHCRERHAVLLGRGCAAPLQPR
jgi:hypothetical protein